SAVAGIVRKYRDEAKSFLSKNLAQQDLLRTKQVAEQNYILYTNKREEARIADALDQKHMVSVAVAEAATVPYFPVLPWYLMVFAAFVLACVASASIGFGAQYLDTSLHTPKEIEGHMELPLLAALPAPTNGHFFFRRRKVLAG